MRMYTKGDDTALHAACTHIEDSLVPMDPYQTDGVLSMLRRSPKTPEQQAKKEAKPSVFTRLRAATKSSTGKDGAPADGKPPAKGLFSRVFGTKPKEQWDVNSKYSNLTKTYVLSHMYHFGEERTPRYGILFGSPKCQYFREVDIIFDKTNSYVSIICKVCPNDIKTRLIFHSNGLPTNYPEWQQTSLLPAQCTQIQWIKNPNEYFFSKTSQQPIPDTTIAENHEAAGEVESTPADHAAVNPYFVQHAPGVEPVAHESVHPLVVTPATPVPAPRVPAAPVSAKPVSKKAAPVAAKAVKKNAVAVKPGSKTPTPQPTKARPVIMHWPSNTEEAYKLTQRRAEIAYKDKWLGYTWAITGIGKDRRFAAISQFERINPDNKISEFVWGQVSKNGIDVPFSILKRNVRDNRTLLDDDQWNQQQITDVKSLRYIRHPELYFADIIANPVLTDK